jgi:hypothetical protein
MGWSMTQRAERKNRPRLDADSLRWKVCFKTVALLAMVEFVHTEWADVKLNHHDYFV